MQCLVKMVAATHDFTCTGVNAPLGRLPAPLVEFKLQPTLAGIQAKEEREVSEERRTGETSIVEVGKPRDSSNRL